ncbi:MAG: hypothetical protein JWP72_1105, partial [Massilia sp.]|nr:hypothetical protein [Massilia sp.]
MRAAAARVARAGAGAILLALCALQGLALL